MPCASPLPEVGYNVAPLMACAPIIGVYYSRRDLYARLLKSFYMALPSPCAVRSISERWRGDLHSCGSPAPSSLGPTPRADRLTYHLCFYPLALRVEGAQLIKASWHVSPSFTAYKILPGMHPTPMEGATPQFRYTQLNLGACRPAYLIYG